MIEQRNRGLLPYRPMRAFFVVVPTPILHFFLGIRKAQEPVRVQTFRSEASVERFNECVVGWLPWSREVEYDAALISLQVQITRDELGALIDPDRRREPHLSADLFKHLHNISAAEGEARFQHR